MSKTIAVDFDGVIHSYSSGWKGADVIPDPPVEGAFAWLEALIAHGLKVVIFSSRTHQSGGVQAMCGWMLANGLPSGVLACIGFPEHKPPVSVTVDDRGWQFDGRFPRPEELEAFAPWNKRSAEQVHASAEKVRELREAIERPMKEAFYAVPGGSEHVEGFTCMPHRALASVRGKEVRPAEPPACSLGDSFTLSEDVRRECERLRKQRDELGRLLSVASASVENVCVLRDHVLGIQR